MGDNDLGQDSQEEEHSSHNLDDRTKNMVSLPTDQNLNVFLLTCRPTFSQTRNSLWQEGAYNKHTTKKTVECIKNIKSLKLRS